VDGVYSTITSVIGSGIFPHEMEITVVVKTSASSTSTSTAPPATGKVTSGSQPNFTRGGNWIGITVGLTIGVLGGIGFMLA
jgi:hypothetical protein